MGYPRDFVGVTFSYGLGGEEKGLALPLRAGWASHTIDTICSSHLRVVERCEED